MPNWRRIKKLRDVIAAEKPRHVRMDVYIADYNGTVGQARTHCGSAGCMLGHAFIQFAPKSARLVDVEDWESAGGLLGLTKEETFYFAAGIWSTKKLPELTKRDVLRYLDAAIAQKTIRVTK